MEVNKNCVWQVTTTLHLKNLLEQLFESAFWLQPFGNESFQNQRFLWKKECIYFVYLFYYTTYSVQKKHIECVEYQLHQTAIYYCWYELFGENGCTDNFLRIWFDFQMIDHPWKSLNNKLLKNESFIMVIKRSQHAGAYSFGFFVLSALLLKFIVWHISEHIWDTLVTKMTFVTKVTQISTVSASHKPVHFIKLQTAQI